jgi:hypothetical protein
MVSPLAQIGRSNDPSLAKRAVNTSSAADALVQALMTQGLTNKGALARQKLKGGIDLDKSYIAKNIAPGTNRGSLLERQRADEEERIRIVNARAAEDFGLGIAKPRPGDTRASAVDPSRPIDPSIVPFALRQAEAGATKNITKSTRDVFRGTPPSSLNIHEKVRVEEGQTTTPGPRSRFTNPLPTTKVAPVKPATKTEAKKAKRIYGKYKVGDEVREGWLVRQPSGGYLPE